MSKLKKSETFIDINAPAADFETHLEENSRILFSSAFGTGKTVFLKHFFGTKEMKEKYNAFHLFPVNYQVATSEDIFELIKYDIVCHLLSTDWIDTKKGKEKFSKLLVFQSYLLNNGTNVLSKIMQCIPVIDKAGKALETALEIRKGFLDYSKQINEDEMTLLKDFSTEFEQRKGSIYEFDPISEFIFNSLAKCSEKTPKENVLIIDDLDRIDPEHIFRLLNVFSAHIDIDENTNKFGFDKIIFVCDVNNIRNIFAAKYGQQTDFSGYIDKFYSSEIFNFNNKVAIINFIEEKIENNSSGNQTEQAYLFSTESRAICNILYLFIEGNVINLRQILNVKDLKQKQKDGIIGRYKYYYPGHVIIRMCLRILGGQKDNLINAFEKAKDPSGNVLNHASNYLLTCLLPLLTDNIYDHVDESSFHKKVNGIDIEYMIKMGESKDIERFIYAQLVSPNLESVSFDTLRSICIEAVNTLDEEGLLY